MTSNSILELSEAPDAISLTWRLVSLAEAITTGTLNSTITPNPTKSARIFARIESARVTITNAASIGKP